jgi:hypothetical protein
MSDEAEVPPSDGERIARLERNVYWLKVAVIIVVVALIVRAIPLIGAAISFLLFTVIVVGGVIAFITSVMYLLDRFYSDSRPKE